MPKESTKKETLMMRIESDVLRIIETIAHEMSGPGVTVTRQDVIRLILQRNVKNLHT